MARVTVEDCIERLPNRFELVMVASQRARKIGTGSPLTIERDNDKNPVVALREVAGETVEIDQLKEELILSHQRFLPVDESEDQIDLMDGEEEWNSIAEQANNKAEGVYADEDVVEEEAAPAAAEPSLEDLAGASE